ncbi:FHA domain-containing protein [Thalassoroseus pseudoceratinae]|uniref:FHA domain-containing protein n=1 Tax=Thalassoroseus pseudoceratinae TaxID=2713176 RepID=UPI0014228054|nr:FHA domain-containing protein [Thalassoroseus pseudoceratinae]
MATLIIQFGKHKGRRLPVPPKDCVVGRDAGCSIRLGSPDISKRHCVVRTTARGLLVRDLGSHNGTFANDVLVTEPTLLEVGDVLRVGTIPFLVAKELSKETVTSKPAAEPSQRRTARPERKSKSGEDEILGWLTDEEGDGRDTTIISENGIDPNADSDSEAVPAHETEQEGSLVAQAADIIRRWRQEHGQTG